MELPTDCARGVSIPGYISVSTVGLGSPTTCY